MGKIWHVKPRELDDRRLVAEHAQLHDLFARINSHYRSPKQNPSELIAPYLKCVGYLVKRHDDLVKEFHQRGFPSGKRHSSLLDTSRLPPIAFSETFLVSKSMVRKDLDELHLRWRKKGVDLRDFGAGERRPGALAFLKETLEKFGKRN